ncbi:MAG: Phosphoesterase family protein [Pedobacter sp.]|nr:Phosphoesterase family protein [Pedobacter sp.]
MKRSILLPAILLSSLVLASCRQATHLPHYDHIVVVIEENHGYDNVIGSSNADFLNKLAKEGALFSDSHGVTHPSQPNYLALFSGSTQGITDDKCLEAETPYATDNLAASLISHGFSFKGFAQTMPNAGYTPCEFEDSKVTDGVLYARKHCPWVNWQGTGDNAIPASVSQPMSAFPKDFSVLPTVSFVVPDQDYDMHNIGGPGDAAAIQRGDAWLKDNLAAYAQWAKSHNSLLIVTFDEDDFRPVNHIATIFAGAHVVPGQYDQQINHYNVLHTLQEIYDLPGTRATANAEVISAIWNKKG